MSTVTTGTPNRWGAQFRLRWSPIDGPELRCGHCGEWWSIGEHAREAWAPGNWSTCRMCLNEANRLRHALKCADDEAYRQRGAARFRRSRDWLIQHHPDLVRALNRERQAAYRAREAERHAAKKAAA